MDTVPANMNAVENVLTRKEIRRQKLMEFLAAKANVMLPSKKPNMVKDEKCKSERSAPKVHNGKENTIPAPNKDVKVKSIQVTSVKKPLGLKNSTNISSSNIYGKQSSKNVLTTTTKDAKSHKIPVFTKTYTIVNSKSTSNAASQKQPFTRAPSVGKGPLKTLSATPAVKLSNITTNLCTNTASSNMDKIESGRMIHGPIIKTRTGLVPAVIQPRKSKPHILPTVNDTKSPTYNVRSRPLSHRAVSQASVTSLRKTLSTITLKPVNKIVTMTTREESKAQNKCRPLAATSKTVEKAQCNTLSNRLQTLSRCSTKSVKPDAKIQTTKAKVLDCCTKPTNALKVDKNKPGVTKPSITMTTSRDNFRAHKVLAACTHGDKSKISKEIQNKKTLSKPFQAPAVPKEKKRPIAPQTAPQPSRAQNLISRTTSMKTPERRALSQSDGKPLTAAQDRIKKLQEWRAAKGISYKRPPMFMKSQARRTIAAPQPFWSHMEEEDEAQSLICAVDRSLEDCIKLLGEGCPTHQVKEVLSRLPAISQKFAKYWICQARLMEQEGNLDVLPMFEKAVGLVLEPIDELRTVVFEILKKRDDNQDKETEPMADSCEMSLETLDNPVTPKPARALICAEKGNSSVVKYKITATPGGHPSQRRDSTVVNGQEVRFFTPVRRSVRIERASLLYPVSLQDHDLCVASYNDLIAEEEKENAQQSQSEGSSSTHNSPMYVYRENEALKDKVFVQYVCGDE